MACDSIGAAFVSPLPFAFHAAAVDNDDDNVVAVAVVVAVVSSADLSSEMTEKGDRAANLPSCGHCTWPNLISSRRGKHGQQKRTP